MKKTIILILAILPIVLLVVIAFAGQILSLYQHIPVERVEFVDRFNNPYTDDHTFTVNQGSSKATSIVIYPELASNKKVTYKSADESVCTIDQDGVIYGKHYGTTTVMVTTDDELKVAILNVVVKADVPYDVYIKEQEDPDDNDMSNDIRITELSMLVGATYELDVVVDAPVSLNKNVTFELSDPSVLKVDAAGKLTALKAGTSVITVTTVSGGITCTCTVNVTEGILPISFDFDGVEGITFVNGVYELNVDSIDLGAYLKVSDEVARENVLISIQSGSSATLDGDVLNFTKTNGLVTIRAYDKTNPSVFSEIKLIYRD